MSASVQNLPPLFLDRISQITDCPHTRKQILDSFAITRYPAFRLHHRQAAREKIIESLTAENFELDQVHWYPDAFRLLNRDIRTLQATSFYQKNEIYIQGLASMLPVLALNPLPGEKILDLCAAPGSKTGQIARHLDGSGEITANEKIRARFFKLKANLDAQGYNNIYLTLRPGEIYCKLAPNAFDRILLDSPCSSEGRFSLNAPDSFKFWSTSKIKEMVFKQRALFKSAFLSLKPGGMMVYATCTFAPEENEGILDWALGRTDNQMEIVEWNPPVSNWIPGITAWNNKIFSVEVKKSRRIIPNAAMTAFFIALIRKKKN